MKKSLIWQSIIVTGLFISAVSCTPEPCFEETEAYVKASFYNDSAKAILAPDSLTIYALNTNQDSLYKNEPNISKVELPLNIGEKSCSFCIMINDKIDTLKFIYSSYTVLLSKECGYTYYHNLDSAPDFTRNAIDTVIVKSENITTANVENITIFY